MTAPAFGKIDLGSDRADFAMNLPDYGSTRPDNEDQR
jgi:hypothetical protein